MRVYLDNAATTPVAPEVVEAMMPYFTEHYGNPSSIHAHGRAARAALEKARKTIAGLLHAAPAEIFFTSGGTETANLIIYQAVHHLGVSRIITSKMEHHCVLHTAESLFRRLKIDYVELDEHGNILYESLEQLLKNQHKTLVCLMHANNEIGTITNIARVGELCKQHGALFFSDTVQTVAHYPIDLQAVHVHFISGSAHKFHGPKGVGFAYIRSDSMLRPLLHGGAQERNMRAGTENLPGIVGMEKAMSLAYARLEEDRRHISGLKKYFLEKLRQHFPDIRVHGNEAENSLYTVLNIGFPRKQDSGMLVFNLDIHGVSASAGSACSSGSDVGSHVLAALGVTDRYEGVRFSFSRYNTTEEMDYTIEKLKEIIRP
ncbi:MAG: cysteine desulfurase [Chitinophagales bacterium]|nr:MAG: cysteine desulfurase [Chitinophagales bacterium]